MVNFATNYYSPPLFHLNQTRPSPSFFIKIWRPLSFIHHLHFLPPPTHILIFSQPQHHPFFSLLYSLQILAKAMSDLQLPCNLWLRFWSVIPAALGISGGGRRRPVVKNKGGSCSFVFSLSWTPFQVDFSFFFSLAWWFSFSSPGGRIPAWWLTANEEEASLFHFKPCKHHLPHWFWILGWILG